MKFYIDTSIFVLAFINSDELGEKARDILDDVVKGKIIAISSLLVFDEFIWTLRKYCTRAQAIDYAKSLLKTPRLRFVTIDEQIVWKACELLQKYSIAPRDALHAASALSGNADIFLTEDKDFKKILELNTKRLGIG